MFIPGAAGNRCRQGAAGTCLQNIRNAQGKVQLLIYGVYAAEFNKLHLADDLRLQAGHRFTETGTAAVLLIRGKLPVTGGELKFSFIQAWTRLCAKHGRSITCQNSSLCKGMYRHQHPEDDGQAHAELHRLAAP